MGKELGALWEHSHDNFEGFWGKNRYNEVISLLHATFWYY